MQTIVIGLLTGIISSKISTSFSFSYTTLIFILLIPFLIYFLIKMIRFIMLYQGVEIINTSPDIYLHDIASELKKVSRKLCFKGFTGHEFFSSKLLRKSFEEANVSNMTKFTCLFASPDAPAYNSESIPNGKSRLVKKHELALEYFDSISKSLMRRNQDLQIETSYIHETKNLINCLLIDNVAYVFIRTLDNQLIFKINLKICNETIRNLINYLFDTYLPSLACQVQQVEFKLKSKENDL